jgi:hypothetical protein
LCCSCFYSRSIFSVLVVFLLLVGQSFSRFGFVFSLGHEQGLCAELNAVLFSAVHGEDSSQSRFLHRDFLGPLVFDLLNSASALFSFLVCVHQSQLLPLPTLNPARWCGRDSAFSCSAGHRALAFSRPRSHVSSCSFSFFG